MNGRKAREGSLLSTKSRKEKERGKKPRRLGERASEDRLRKGEKASGVENKERERGRERENNGVARKKNGVAREEKEHRLVKAKRW